MRFQLRSDDQRLIDAAIAFGEWLAQHPATTPGQRSAIALLQGALRRLPEDSPEILLCAEYGVNIAPADFGAGIYRNWTVLLWRQARSMPGVLEIFNTYTTVPAPARPGEPAPVHGDLYEDAAHESSFFLRANEPNANEDDWRDLIDEFRNFPPIPTDAIVEIEAAAGRT